MTMLDTLFGLIPAASRGQQWVAGDLQLVNWGGYDGHHRVRFSPTATLLCGGSGSGKSTLMDAYVALMMPHTTPFNGASNGAVIGRPRGQDQRNILSYGRGKTDETRTDEGTKITVLRGDGVDTWTAISMTWLDHDGSQFTAVRAWYIPANARVLEDTVRVRATISGSLDLSDLEGAAQQRLTDASVKATGLDTLPTDREFSARLHNVLGIGAAGAGAKAMSLLARIQAGQQITTVDDLYKRMVLEEPATLAAADDVVTHFDSLESTRTRMLTAQQQVRALEPIRTARERIEADADRLRVLDEVGRFTDPDSLASLWRASNRLELLRDLETELRSRTHDAAARSSEAAALADAAEAEYEGLLEVRRAAGGDRLETAKRELRGLKPRLESAARERRKLDAALEVLNDTVTTAEEFHNQSARAVEALADPEAKQTARTRYATARNAQSATKAAVDSLESEEQQIKDRQDNIPEPLRVARDLLARTSGLEPSEVPFVGELIEVRTEFEPWREAFNLALGGFATTLLIDTAHLSSFRAAINTLSSRERLRFEGVHTGLRPRNAADPHTLPGRLDYKASPFTGWLEGELEKRFGFVCVDSPDQLSAHRMALTISGQISQGARGAHGGHGRANVLGFSTQRRLGELAVLLRDARTAHATATAEVEGAEAELDAVDARLAAFGTLRDLSWEQVDVASIASECERWEAVILEVTAENPDLASIQTQIDHKRAQTSALREQIGQIKAEKKRLAETWTETTDEVDAAQSVIDAAESASRALTTEQATYLDGKITATDNEDTSTKAGVLARFDAELDSAARRFGDDQREAQEALVEQRERVRHTMTSFLDRWPNPNLLADPDRSLADFERVLTDLETSGLHELETEWRDSLLKLSGNDLTNLDSTLSRALREIRDRITPINQIMQDLPFYDDEHRLQITLRENQSEVRRRFRRDLREVRAQIEAATSEEDRERIYRRMSRLIERLRRNAPEFAEVVDVRNHVRVSAERIHAQTKQHVALYDHIGEKSGGESQELIAFIVGAALRYQLGDAGSERPRYAPVFLDEALIKADAHFTKRAIGAWRGLGFQLIIGAPNDKYSAIEPHVDVEYDILKDTLGRSWAKPKVALPEAPA